MRRSHNNIPTLAELESMLNPSAVIPLIENAISMENVPMEANKLLSNEQDYLSSEYKITQAKILLSLLRRRSRTQLI
jgi:hypothetical protein